MVFSLAAGFVRARDSLARDGILTKVSIERALREIQRAMIVNGIDLRIVEPFVGRLRTRLLASVGHIEPDSDVDRYRANGLLMRVCNEELDALFEPLREVLTFAPGGPTVLLMVGLRGAGKTTAAAKLAYHLKQAGKRPLLVTTDTQRSSAIQQLQALAAPLRIPAIAVPDGHVTQAYQRVLSLAQHEQADVVIIDTAGSTTADEVWLRHLGKIKSASEAHHVLLVVDAMVGLNFDPSARVCQQLSVRGVVLTKIDGCHRASSLFTQPALGVPVLFLSRSEAPDCLETFLAWAQRTRLIFMEDFVVECGDSVPVGCMKIHCPEGPLLYDILGQIRHHRRRLKAAPLPEMLARFFATSPEAQDLDAWEIRRTEAIIESMTRKEIYDVWLLIREPGRTRRIAGGSGCTEDQVKQVIERYLSLC